MQADDTKTDRWPPFKIGGKEGAVKPLNDLIHHAEALIEQELETERSSTALATAVREVHRSADDKLDQLLASIANATASDPSGQVKCRAGCCHCCYRVPEASVPEVALIWSHIADSFSPDDKKQLQSRIENYVQQTSVFRPAELGNSRVACPLLSDSHCSVYEARPMSCRGLNATDVSACESIRLGNRSAKERPKWADLVVLTTALRMGIRIGAFFEAMDPITVDLGYALKVLLGQPDAIEQYVNGKDCFTDSLSSVECEALDANQIAASNGPVYLSMDELLLPSGNLPIQEAADIRKHAAAYLQDGDYHCFVRTLDGHTAGKMMARINVPRVGMSEDEIDESRMQFVHAMRDFEAAGFQPSEAFNALSFHQTMNLAYQGRNDLELLRDHGKFVVEEISSKALPQFAQARERKRKPGKLRVGYISGNLNSSNNGRWAWPWVRHHSSDIETFCFLVGPNPDKITNLFRAYSAHFFWLNRSVPTNAAFIRSLDLDVLIFTDIGLYARSTQYSSMRLAPVQCTAWGGPETSGLPTIDYYLSSEYMEPANGDSFYSEKLIKLPRTGMLFYKDATAVPNCDRSHFGLPESGPLILMGQACMKLVPKFDLLFTRICDRLGCEIVFLESNPPGDSRKVKERLRKAGVRARWIPAVSSSEYLALLRLADVSIDPHMWSGGNTTVQALSLGTPVVTWPGPYMRGRHSLAFLRQANTPGLVASGEDDYVDLVCDFDRQREAAKGLDADALYGDIGVVRKLDEFLFTASHLS